MECWQDVLNHFLFPGDESRSTAVCDFIIANVFVSFSQLDCAEHPREWIGEWFECYGVVQTLLGTTHRLGANVAAGVRLRGHTKNRKEEKECEVGNPWVSYLQYASARFCRVRPVETKAEMDEVAKQLKRGDTELLVERPKNITSARAGPRVALRRLCLGDLTQAERDVWHENARVEALLSPCRLSMPSFRSGLRCWFAFIG